jgi:hypothetical protein
MRLKLLRSRRKLLCQKRPNPKGPPMNKPGMNPGREVQHEPDEH